MITKQTRLAALRAMPRNEVLADYLLAVFGTDTAPDWVIRDAVSAGKVWMIGAIIAAEYGEKV